MIFSLNDRRGYLSVFVAILLVASIVACGGKKKKPDDNTDTNNSSQVDLSKYVKKEDHDAAVSAYEEKLKALQESVEKCQTDCSATVAKELSAAQAKIFKAIAVLDKNVMEAFELLPNMCPDQGTTDEETVKSFQAKIEAALKQVADLETLLDAIKKAQPSDSEYAKLAEKLEGLKKLIGFLKDHPCPNKADPAPGDVDPAPPVPNDPNTPTDPNTPGGSDPDAPCEDQTITGKVVDKNSVAIVGADVSLKQGLLTDSVKTGADGKFQSTKTFDKVDGPVTIVVKATGKKLKEITIELCSGNQELVITLEDETPSPAPNNTDDDSPGTVPAEPMSKNKEPTNLMPKDAGNANGSTEPLRANTLTRANDDCKSGKISGIVTNAKGEPVAGADVTATDADGKILGTTKSAADGSYSFENVKSVVFIEIKQKGFKPVKMKVEIPCDISGTFDLKDATLIAVGE